MVTACSSYVQSVTQRFDYMILLYKAHPWEQGQHDTCVLCFFAVSQSLTAYTTAVTICRVTGTGPRAGWIGSLAMGTHDATACRHPDI